MPPSHASLIGAGCWCAVVGMPHLGLVAAAELGVVLERQRWSASPAASPVFRT